MLEELTPYCPRWKCGPGSSNAHRLGESCRPTGSEAGLACSLEGSSSAETRQWPRPGGGKPPAGEQAVLTSLILPITCLGPGTFFPINTM